MPRRVLIALLAGLVGGAAYGQVFVPPDAEEQEEQDKPLFSINVTPTLMENMIGQMVERQLTPTYQFDEYQAEQTRRLIQERVGGWLRENGDKIEPLVNTYMEAVTSRTPPTPEEVAEWATQMQAVKDDFMVVLDDMTTEMRTYLTEDQIVVMEGELAAINVASGFLDQRLGAWSEGHFNPETDWPQGRRFREAQRERDKVAHEAITEARQEAIQVAGDDPTRVGRVATKQQTQDKWAKYVEAFIEKYQLNAQQIQLAQRLLSNAQRHRDNWLLQRAQQFDRVEQGLAAADTDEEKAQYLAQYEKLVAPINNQETSLKQKLESIPTRAQRRAAQEREAQGEQDTEQAQRAEDGADAVAAN